MLNECIGKSIMIESYLFLDFILITSYLKYVKNKCIVSVEIAFVSIEMFN